MEGKRVNTRPLKEFVSRKLPVGSPLREILLKEKDEVDVADFVARIPIYLQLISSENKQDRD